MKTVIHWPQFIVMLVLVFAPSGIIGAAVENVILAASFGVLFGTIIPIVYMEFVDVWHFEDENGRRL